VLTNPSYDTVMLSEAPQIGIDNPHQWREVEASRECLQHQYGVKAFARDGMEKTP
jgi:hypothetical protein